jgi:hypothetical protein
VITGPAGNIAAHDLYGPCCRVNVFVQNALPFTGGQEARSFPMVTSLDRDGTVSQLKAALEQSVQAALQTQVHPDETLVQPVACTSQITTDHAVGEEATQVRVTVNESCTGQVYSTQAVHDRMVQVVMQVADRQLGAGYTLSGEIKERVEQSQGKDQKQGTALLHLSGEGIWTYQFTQGQLQSIAALVAGKHKTEATQQVLQLAGVKSVSMHVDGQDEMVLPSDPHNIHLLVVYGG